VKPKTEDLPFEALPDGRELPVPVEPYRPWRPASTADNPRPRMRCFVPATLADNPKLLERDPDYVDRLRANSNRALRKAYEEGDWDAIDAVEGALWTGEDLDGGRVRVTAPSARRVVAVDPSDGDESGDGFGVSVCSRGRDGVGYVEDSHEWRMSPRKMAEAAVQLYHHVGADALVVEKNHGGKWMLEVFRQVDPYVNLVVTWASDGKRTRAEPVAALFEYDEHALLKYRARIVGWQEELEQELTDTNFRDGEPSPNRLDAMVWAMTELMLGTRIAKSDGQIHDQRLSGRR
jgi:phage terminase large subunit-like protein